MVSGFIDEISFIIFKFIQKFNSYNNKFLNKKLIHKNTKINILGLGNCIQNEFIFDLRYLNYIKIYFKNSNELNFNSIS